MGRLHHPPDLLGALWLLDVIPTGGKAKLRQARRLQGGANNGAGHDRGGDGSNGRDIRFDLRGGRGKSKDGFAVGYGVDGIDGAGIAIMRHLGDLCHLGFREGCIGRDNTDGGVGAVLRDDIVAVQNAAHGVAEALAILAAGAGDDLARIRVDDVSKRVRA